MKDPRFRKINELFIQYALGNFDYKAKLSPKLDEVDAFISNINMLGEELKQTTISRNYFNNIFNSVSDMLFVLDDRGKIKNVNKMVVEKLRYGIRELSGKPIRFLNASSRNLLYKNIKKKLNNTVFYTEFETEFKPKRQNNIPIHCTISYLYTEKNKKAGYLLIARDLSNIKKYEKSLKQSEEKYKKIFHESNDPIFVTDVHGNMLEFNKAGLKLFSFSKKELKGINYFKLFAVSEEMKRFSKDIKQKGTILNRKLKFYDKKNKVIDCLVSANIIVDNDGKITGYQGIIKDIRKQKETEALIIRTIVDTQEAERERFATDLHDSLGQQLSGIKFQMAILAKTKGKDEDRLRDIILRSNNAIDAAIFELRTICFNLMPRTLESFGLFDAVRELCRKMQESSGINFLIIMEKFDMIKPLEIAIFRILQEFITNSLKHGQANKISIKIYPKNNDLYVFLKDDGIGFDIEKLNKNEGMGLRNVRSRVESYNGDIKIKSVTGKGTSYKITVPLS